MTLFESEIRKLNIPRCIMDSIVSLRNICMEAEQPQPQQATQPAQKQPQPQQQQPKPQQNAAPQQQPAPQAQPQQNAPQTAQQPAAGNQQGQTQPPAQENGQPQQTAQPQQANNAQGKQQIPENIDENQVDSNKLLKQFNNFLEGCRKRVEERLIADFGDKGKTIIETVKEYTKTGSPIDFDMEILPLLTKNGEAPTKKVINEVRDRLQKYFGLKISEPKQKQQQKNENKQEQPAKTDEKQEAPQK